MPTLEEFTLATKYPQVDEETPVGTSDTVSIQEFMGTSVPGDEIPKPRNPVEGMPPAFQSFLSGLGKFNAGLARIPAVVYDFAAIPQNAVERVTGWRVGTEAPDWLADNPLAKYYDRGSESYNYNQRVYRGEDFTSLMGEGRFQEAGDYLFNAIIENSVYSLTAIGGHLAGVPQPQTLALLGLSAAADNFSQGRAKGVDALENATAALLNGGLEAAFESVGTFGLLKWGEDLFKDVGVKAGKSIINRVFKLVLGSSLGEGNEEVFTQLTQDLTNMSLGVEEIEVRDLPRRAINAGVVGLGAGATMTAPGGAVAGIRVSRAQRDQERLQAILDQIAPTEAAQPEAAPAAAPEAPTAAPTVIPPVTPQAAPTVQPETPAAEAEADVAFDFGVNVADQVIAQETPTLSRLQARLEAIDDARARAEVAQEAKGRLDEIFNSLRRRIRPFRKGVEAEEFRAVPQVFKSKEGIPLDEAAESINEQFPELGIADSNQLIEFLKALPVRRQELTDIIKEAKTQTKRVREPTVLKQRIRDIRSGIEAGKRFGRKEIKAVQTELIEALKQSELEAKDKAKFLPVLRSVQTQAQLEKALPGIVERIESLESAAVKREAIEELRALASPTTLKGLRPEFLKPVQKFLEGIALTKPTEAKLQGLRNLAEFLEREPDNLVPQKRLNELKLLEQKSVSDLTTEDVQALRDALTHLIALNQFKNKILVGRTLRDFDETVTQAVTNVNRAAERAGRASSITGLDSFQKEHEVGLWSRIRRIFGGESFNAELKTEILDGADGEAIQRIVYNGINRGVDVEFRHQHRAEDFFKERLAGIGVSRWSSAFQIKEKDIDSVTVPISGKRTLTMTKGERVAFLLHDRNVRNKAHLTEGGFSFSNTPSKINKLTAKDVRAIVDSATDEETKTADAIHEYFNTVQKDAINAVSVRLIGHEVAREDDYFPIRTNFLDRFRDDLIRTGKFTHITLEGLGIFKERIDATNALIVEDAFVATYKSIKQTSAYVGLAEPLRSAKALLNNNEFQKSVRLAGKGHYIDSLKRYIARVEGDSIRLENIDQLTQDLINKVDVAILGINPFVVAKQPVSYLAAATEMDMELLRRNFRVAASDAEIAEIRTWSPQLRDRFDGNVTRELGEIAEVGSAKRFFTGQTSVSQKFMVGIRKGDAAAVSSIWRAVKEETHINQPELAGDAFLQTVADRAWFVIRRTQPTFHVKDRSDIGMSRNVYVRLLTKYSSQRNKNWMMLHRSAERYNRSNKTPADRAKAIGDISLVAILLPLFIVLIDELRDTVLGRGEKEDLFAELVTRWFATTVSSIYFLGTGFSSLLSKIQRGTYAGYDVDDPLTQTFDDLINTVAEAVRSVQFAASGERYRSGQFRGEEKWAVAAKRSTISAIDTAARLKGIPLASVRKLLRIGVEQPGEKVTGPL